MESQKTPTREEVTAKASEFLNSQPDFSQRDIILKYSKFAAEYDMFYAARELLQMVMNNEKYKFVPTEKDHQNLAKYIYKDPNLSSDYKYERALIQLPKHKDISLVDDCETAGLIGAVYKRKWYFDKEINHLETSEKFYSKGYQIWKNNKNDFNIDYNEGDQLPKNDFGYCANNLAFVKELLAKEKYKSLKSTNDSDPEYFKNIINEVKTIRIEIITSLANENQENLKPEILNWHKKNNNDTDDFNGLRFHYATLIEALVGNGSYEKANKVITIYNSLFNNNNNWKKRSTIEQLHLLLDLQQFINNTIQKLDGYDSVPFENCVRTIYDKKENFPIPTTQNKVGLALSGGGFRASYFHIGVLAALSENDKLKDVEVVSCVSGGSILGAFYFLKLRNLLNTKSENHLTPTHYQCLVKEMITEFHNGVKENLRARWFSSFWANLKMAVLLDYSRTNRMSELYDTFFYKNITSEDKIALRKTIINPIEKPKFNIHSDNYSRVYKVPQLILNTTSLNTGHNFQFASTWMGEPPILINHEINVKPRLKRVYYSFLSDEKYKNYPLCNAVGASACVPALFIALVLKNLYKDMKLKLVDGGVYDNQGISAIIENECKNCIISDASGQLTLESSSPINPFGELFRSSNVSAEHIRELQLNHMIKDAKNYFYDSLHVLHLKKDLQEGALSALNATSNNSGNLINQTPSVSTTYNVNKDLQRAISNIRTDLDSFTDAEAYALMYSGYLQTIASLKAIDSNTKSDLKWEFKGIENEFVSAKELTEELTIGSKMFFKGWYLLKLKYPKVTFGSIFIIVLALIIGLVNPILNGSFSNTICQFLHSPWKLMCSGGFTLSSQWKIIILVLGIIEIAGKPIFNKMGLKNTPIRMIVNFLFLNIAMLISWFYLYTFNKLYNWLGRRNY